MWEEQKSRYPEIVDAIEYCERQPLLIFVMRGSANSLGIDDAIAKLRKGAAIANAENPTPFHILLQGQFGKPSFKEYLIERHGVGETDESRAARIARWVEKYPGVATAIEFNEMDPSMMDAPKDMLGRIGFAAVIGKFQEIMKTVCDITAGDFAKDAKKQMATIEFADYMADRLECVNTVRIHQKWPTIKDAIDYHELMPETIKKIKALALAKGIYKAIDSLRFNFGLACACVPTPSDAKVGEQMMRPEFVEYIKERISS